MATWSIAGYLVESAGWQYAFYVPAILTGCFTVIWFITTFDDPAKHPRITKQEKEYIENSLLGITHVKVIIAIHFFIRRKYNFMPQFIKCICIALASIVTCGEIYSILGTILFTLWQSLGVVLSNDSGTEIYERGKIFKVNNDSMSKIIEI